MWIRFLRFLAVGVGNTAFGYAIFAASYLILDSYRTAIVIATAIGVLFNYVTTGLIVFANRGIRALGPFIVGYAAVCGANILLVDGLVAVGPKPLLAQLIALPFIAVLSFIINDRIIFGRVA